MCVNVLRTGLGLGPSLRYEKMEFCDNSTSMPQMGYLIYILFKSPGPNVAPPTFGSHDLLSSELSR